MRLSRTWPACALLLAPLSLVTQIPTDNPLRTRTDSVIHTAVTAFFAQPCHVGQAIGLFG